jgi:hypothetical protein
MKQVEQVTTFVLEGPARRFARIRGNYCIGCYLAAKTARRGEGDRFVKGQSGTCGA